MTISET